MKTATAKEKTQIKILRASNTRVEAGQTFQKWLAQEVATGRIIGPKNFKRKPLPKKPKETINFWPIYEEIKEDKF